MHLKPFRVSLIAAVVSLCVAGCAGNTARGGDSGGTLTGNQGMQAVDDVAITNNVQATLAHTPGVKAYEINVQSNGGIVTLSGDVDSDSQAQAAVQAARNVRGVIDVKDQMDVAGGS